jgi:hypothetical protein
MGDEASGWRKDMMSKYVIFAIAAILVLSSSSTVFATTCNNTVCLPKTLVQTNGPRIDRITFTVTGSTPGAQMTAGGINVYDLSFGVGDFNSLSKNTNTKVDTGSTPGYSFDGIEFNMLRAITNDTHFHRAIAYLMDLSYFETTVLSGVAGITSDSVLPCQIFAAGCVDSTTVQIGPVYDSTEAGSGGVPLSHAVYELQNVRLLTGCNPLTSICSGTGAAMLTAKTSITGSTNSTDCAPTAAYPGTGATFSWHSDCAGLKWKTTMTTDSYGPAGTTFVPAWVYRTSLSRNYFSIITQGNANKIGLTFTLPGDGKMDYAKPNVINQITGVTVRNGQYCTGPTATCFAKGYNSAPVFDFTATKAGGTDDWDMYSYGYSASVNFAGSTNMFDTQFLKATTDDTGYYNETAAFHANNVYYALNGGVAVTAGKAWTFDQMDQLPMLNVYFENTLFGVYANGWAGYANIPTYGPDTSGGLGYTALNVHKTCFTTGLLTPPAHTCPNGGNFQLGLAAAVDPSGGMNPMYQGLTVYDDDVWLNIYDSALSTPPTGFQTPETFIPWMTTALPVTHVHLNTFTGHGTGWFDFCQSLAVSGLCNTAAGASTTGLKLVDGTSYTFNFLPNIYFTDGIQMTGKDYNYSLFAAGVQPSNALPDMATDFYGSVSGPLGLVATYVNPSNPLQITVYLNSTTAWNLGNLQIPIVPQHVWQYFNLDTTETAVTTLDTALPFGQAVNGNPSYCTYSCASVPSWIQHLPNLEVATGPFYLRTINELTSTGLLLRNLNYYRNYWQSYTINASQIVAKGTVYKLSIPITQLTYSGGTSGSTTNVKITSAITGTAQVYTGSVAGPKYTLSCSLGVCHANIATSALAKGAHEIIITAKYTYLLKARVYYRQYGFQVK